jgi:hypothetical protein
MRKFDRFIRYYLREAYGSLRNVSDYITEEHNSKTKKAVTSKRNYLIFNLIL